jgi:hypothetical protein
MNIGFPVRRQATPTWKRAGKAGDDESRDFGLLGFRRLTASLPSDAQSGRSADMTGRAMTALIERSAACLGAARWDPVRLGTAIARCRTCAERAEAPEG